MAEKREKMQKEKIGDLDSLSQFILNFAVRSPPFKGWVERY